MQNSNERYRYYPKHRNRRKNNTFQVALVGIGSAATIYGAALGISKLFHAVENDTVPIIEPTSIVSVIPEEVEPAVIIPKYRSLLSMELRDNLDSYLDQDSNHYCDDLEEKGVTTTDHLRLRKGPGTDYDIITELDDDLFVEVIGVCDNNWYLVRTNSGIGFVSGDYLRVLSNEYIHSQEINSTSLCVLRGIRSNTSLNVRDSASENGEVIGSLSQGQTFVIEDHLDNGWYQIQYGDRTGYVSGDYVSEIYAASLEELPYIYIREDAPISKKPYENSIGTITHDQFVQIYGENDEYYFIENNGSYGYIPKDKCERMSDYYAIVDISDQTLKVYHNGEEVLSTRVVTGKDSTPTREGYFSIYSKLDHTVMEGVGYRVEVDNVLYFDNGIALHPMNRGEYDYSNDVYHVNGSHGCVNTPPTAMQKVYEYLNVGDRVFVKD